MHAPFVNTKVWWQNFLFQYNESQCSVEKYNISIWILKHFFVGWTIPLRLHTDVQVQGKRNKGWKKGQHDSERLTSFLIFSYSLWRLSYWRSTAEIQGRQLNMSLSFPWTIRSVNATHYTEDQLERKLLQTTTHVQREDCSWKPVLIYTKVFLMLQKYIITNTGNSLPGWDIHLLVKMITVLLISVYNLTAVWISISSTEYASNFRTEDVICKGFTNHGVWVINVRVTQTTMKKRQEQTVTSV